MSRFRKLPPVVDARRFIPNQGLEDYMDWHGIPFIKTINGDISINYGDIIVFEPGVGKYILSEEVFKQSFEQID